MLNNRLPVYIRTVLGQQIIAKRAYRLAISASRPSSNIACYKSRVTALFCIELLAEFYSACFAVSGSNIYGKV